MAPAEMFTVVGDHVFPFRRTLGGEGSTYATPIRDARFTIPTPGLLQKAVDGLDGVPMGDRDAKGDVYEYMLSKIATGVFRPCAGVSTAIVLFIKTNSGGTGHVWFYDLQATVAASTTSAPSSSPLPSSGHPWRGAHRDTSEAHIRPDDTRVDVGTCTRSSRVLG